MHASDADDKQLTHLDAQGRTRMVDVGEKPVTARRAVAEGYVCINDALAEAIRHNQLAKGNLFEVARIAGIQAAKCTDELVPLCHGLPLDAVHVNLALEAGRVRLEAEARTTAKTGVEMEALTAVSVAALTVIDMGKALDRHMVVEGVRLLEKTGGRSGTIRAEDAPNAPKPDETA